MGILPFLTGASPLNHSTHYLEHQALRLTSSSVHLITSHYAGGARLFASARAQPLLALLWVLSLPIPVILLSLHLALSGWCSTLRVGTCSTFCWHFLGSSPPSLVILCHVSGCVSPHSRLLLLRSLPCSAFLAGTAHSVSEELCSTSCRHVLNLLLALFFMGF